MAKKKKLEIKGKTSGGSQHTRKKRPSTKAKHEKGRTAKRKSYGGEKGDHGRAFPKKKWVQLLLQHSISGCSLDS